MLVTRPHPKLRQGYYTVTCWALRVASQGWWLGSVCAKICRSQNLSFQQTKALAKSLSSGGSCLRKHLGCLALCTAGGWESRRLVTQKHDSPIDENILYTSSDGDCVLVFLQFSALDYVKSRARAQSKDFFNENKPHVCPSQRVQHTLHWPTAALCSVKPPPTYRTARRQGYQPRSD